jgi:tRNA 2-selenouridine synthase
VYVEGESKKIGQLQVPEALIGRMRASPCVRLDTDAETRVTLLLQEYEFFLKNQETLYQQLDCLVSLHGRERIAAWKALAAQGAWREFVARLLTEHYDPAYRRSSHQNFVRLVDARSVRIASAEETAFSRAAQSLLASSELQPA